MRNSKQMNLPIEEREVPELESELERYKDYPRGRAGSMRPLQTKIHLTTTLLLRAGRRILREDSYPCKIVMYSKNVYRDHLNKRAQCLEAVCQPR